MNLLPLKKDSLSTYIDKLQSQGRYTFLKTEALKDLGCKSQSFDRAVRRLAQKRRLGVIKPGLLMIIPLEYQSWNSIPPEWFIKDLMAYLNQPYYVGLLSAAAWYGAAHQQPQQFQVITNHPVRPIHQGNMSIHFFKKKKLKTTPVQEFQTHTGLIQISTPEATAFDLVKFYKSTGHLNHVATVLVELIEQLDPTLLLKTAQQAHYEWPVIQRLGYLLSMEAVGGYSVATPLAQWLQTTQARFVPLVSYKTYQNVPKDPIWRILINDSIETDL